jgi:hypothetical protein
MNPGLFYSLSFLLFSKRRWFPQIRFFSVKMPELGNLNVGSGAKLFYNTIKPNPYLVVQDYNSQNAISFPDPPNER